MNNPQTKTELDSLAQCLNDLLKSEKRSQIPKSTKIRARTLLKQLFSLTQEDQQPIDSRRLYNLEREIESLCNFDKQPLLPKHFSYLKIRTFFKLNAYTKDKTTLPIALNIMDADSQKITKRFDRFIEIASRQIQSTASEETIKGYEEPLLENLPDKNLVLHPRKKR